VQRNLKERIAHEKRGFIEICQWKGYYHQ